MYLIIGPAAAAAKALQSCPTLCDPIDGSPPGSALPGILQARTLEWVAISFSNTWKWKVKVKSLSCPTLSDPMDCSPPGSSIHGIFQARVLERVAIAFSDSTCLAGANYKWVVQAPICFHVKAWNWILGSYSASDTVFQKVIFLKDTYSREHYECYLNKIWRLIWFHCVTLYTSSCLPTASSD